MKILKQLSIYTLVGLISASVSFLVMPVLSHYLSPGDYGFLSLFNVYVTILIPVMSVSAYSILTVDYFKLKDKAEFASKFSSVQTIPLVSTIFLGIITWSFFGNFADDLELGNIGISWGFIIIILALLSIYYEQFSQFLIIQKKTTAFALTSLAKVFIEVGLTFYLIVYRGWNWEGRIYAWLITTIIFFIVGFIYFQKQGFLNNRVRWTYIREALIFGAPLVLHGVGKFVINQSDRLFIIKMVPSGLSAAGIYNIGYTVGSLVMIVVNAFFNYYSPYLLERLSDITEEKKLQIVKLSYYYIAGTIILLIFLSILAPPFFEFFIDQRYYTGLEYVFWIALGYCFWGAYMLFSGFIFYLKRTRILGWLAIFNVAFNLLFNYIFIKKFGAIGAAYATALSFFLVMVIVATISQRLYPMPWSSFKQLKTMNI